MKKPTELTRPMLDMIAESNPGDFALYRVEDGRLTGLYASAGLHLLSGMSPEEYEQAVRENAADVILDADRGMIALRLGELLRGGRDQDLTYRILHKQTGFVWVHAKARCIGTLDGLPVVMVAYSGTSMEAEEHALLLDHTSSIIYVVDRETCELLYANEMALKLWGGGDYAGQPCYRFINGRDEPCPWCSIPRMKDGACHVEAAYSPMQDMWFSVDCKSMRWHGHEAVAVYTRDVTRQQRRQESLELDKKNVDAILGNIPGGVAVFSDRDGAIRLEYTNDGFYAVHFGSREYWTSQSSDPVDWLTEEDRHIFREEFGRIKTGRKERGSATYRVRGEDGNTHWVNNQFRPAYVRDGVQYYYSSFAGVDDQFKAEQARSEARRLYEFAVEKTGLVVWEYDIVNHRVVMAENEFTEYDYRKFGLPKVIENAPESLVTFIDERYVDEFLGMYRAVDNGAPEASCEVWYKLTAGREPRCERIFYRTVFDGEGRPVKAYGIGQNVTARKLEQENYDRLYRQISGSLGNAIASFQLNLSKDIYLKGYSTNPALLARLQTRTADAHLAAAIDTALEKYRGELREEFNCHNLIARFREGVTQLTREYPARAAAGGTVWVSTVVFLLQNPASGDVEAVTYVKDITRQKKDEEIIYRFARDGCDFVGLIDPVTRSFELHNGVWDCEGFAPGARVDYAYARGRLVDGYLLPEEREGFLESTGLEALADRLARESQLTLAYTFSDSEEGKRNKQLRFSWLNEEHSEILVIQSDVTEAHRKEQNQIRMLQEAVLEAENASSAKTEFVSRISHDIRTPISIISSMTGFAFEDLDDREKLGADLRKIEAANSFLLSLVNDVLDISKIDSGKIELDPQPYLLADYVSNIRNMFEPLCQQKKLSFTISDLPAAGVILVDRTRLNQITLNLLSNAVKYTPAGGRVEFSARSARGEDGRLLCSIRVADSGIGMSEEFQKVMFEPFTQEYENPDRDRTSSGTGLGLSIVKKLVGLMGGDIEVKSGLGRGTEFLVRFAAEEALPPTPGATERRRREPAPAPEKLSGTVLLAEDNLINTEIAKRILEEIGLKTVHAENGREAVELFSSAPPGTFLAVLMDIQMPLMNGYEAAEKIRALDRPGAGKPPSSP